MEWQQALGPDVEVTFDDNNSSTMDFDAIAELNFDEMSDAGPLYAGYDGWFFVCSVKMSLQQMLTQRQGKLPKKLVGINALPSFIGRKSLEFTVSDQNLKSDAEALISSWGLKPEFVEDRVGMVTPRLVFMIINEAFYTLQEGTATAADIDTGMKLGTNYPMGPFEWCEKAGIANVYETLEALWNDTHDERYKICPLLKTRYLQNLQHKTTVNSNAR